MPPGQLVFFVGSHRTGSASLARFFDEHVPGTTSVHQRASHLALNELAGIRSAGLISQGIHDRASRRLLVRRLASSTAERVVETNGFSHMAIAAALERVPTASVIHVVRDPRDFISSMTGFRARKPVKRFVQLHLPFWDYGPRLPEPKKLAWQWNHKNRFIDEAYGSHASFLRLRFEDLFDPATDAYERMLAFVDPDIDAAAHRSQFFSTHLNPAADRLPPERPGSGEWAEWPPELCRYVHETCGELMGEYGYGNEPDWLAATRSGVGCERT